MSPGFIFLVLREIFGRDVMIRLSLCSGLLALAVFVVFIMVSLSHAWGLETFVHGSHFWLALMVPYQVILMWIMVTLPQGEKYFPGVQREIRMVIPGIWVVSIPLAVYGVWVFGSSGGGGGFLLPIAASGLFCLIVSALAFWASFSRRFDF